MSKTIKQLEEEREREYRLEKLNNIMPGWKAEYKFHPTRKWAFDFAHPLYKIAVEIEGGAWTHGRHTRGAGFIGDMEKYNAATVRDWKVLRFTPDQKQQMTDTVGEALLQDSEEAF